MTNNTNPIVSGSGGSRSRPARAGTKVISRAGFFSSRARVVSVIWLSTIAMLASASEVRAEQNDYVDCTATQHDRLRTDNELAGTIATCTRVLQDSSASAEQRANAYFFRGLNHFLKATHIALAEMKPIGSAGEASQVELKLALDDLAASIATAPRPMPQPFSLRATIYSALGQFDGALSDLAEAIRADPKVSTHHVQRALILERLNRFSEARTEFDAAVELDPGNQNAWIERAVLWARYGDFEQAFADYNRAEATGGAQTWRAFSGRARLAVVLGEPARGFADWTTAAETSLLPMLAAQFHVRAGNLARDYLKDLDKAQQAYGRALAALPSYAEALVQRGLAFERANRFDEAINDYRKASEITRNNAFESVTHNYSLFRLRVLQTRLSRKAGDPPLPPNVNVLTRSASIDKGQGRRVGLVIGNAVYAKVPSLMNSDRDAEGVGQALSEAGFSSVTVGTNLDRSRLEGVLQQFARDAAGADWAIIYYAGHGIEVDGVNYAIPVDADMEALKDMPSRAISIDQMIAAAAPAKGLRMIVLDACRDDPFVQEAHRGAASKRAASKRALDKSANNTLDPLIARRKEIGGGLAGLQTTQSNTIALFSTQPGQVTLDGDELNSPFTRAFLKNLPSPKLDLRSFLDRVSEDVVNSTQGRQRPAFSGQLREGERFLFFPDL